ncbi:hypothetical protein LLH23_19370 [bacterium]|nr:hypothetical protein [bacterium]
MSTPGRRAWFVAALVFFSTPVWANYSWGQMGQFRPGIQAAIVVLVLAVEWLVIWLMTRMSWLAALITTVGANALSGLIGYAVVGAMQLTDPQQLFVLVIPSVIIETSVVLPCARSSSERPSHRAHWAFIAVIVANVLSAAVSFGFLQLNYGSEPQPIFGREGWMLAGGAYFLRSTAPKHGGSIRSAVTDTSSTPMMFRAAVGSRGKALLDVAPPWLPWSRRAWVAPYQVGGVPDRLAPDGQGQPMLWTGGPYLQGRRGVVFTDGSFRLMSEREFCKLGAVPHPPPDWLVQAVERSPTQSHPTGTPRP